MTETEADLAKALERFDKGMDAIVADPEGFRAKMDKELIEEKGQEWFDKHKSYIDKDWESVRNLLGI